MGSRVDCDGDLPYIGLARNNGSCDGDRETAGVTVTKARSDGETEEGPTDKGGVSSNATDGVLSLLS